MASGYPRLIIKEMNAQCFAAVLDFLYVMKITVAPSTLAGILHAADRLEVVSLLELGASFLKESMADASCVSTWMVADTINRPELSALRTECKSFALRRFTGIVESEAFIELPRALLITLLSADMLEATEPIVCDSLLRWLAARTEPMPDPDVLELFSLIRHPLLDGDYLARRVEPVLSKLEGGTALLLEAYRYHAISPELRKQRQSPLTKPRMPIFPTGVQRDVDQSVLRTWKVHFERGYNEGLTRADIEGVPSDAKHVFVGARRPDGSIALGAFGRRDAVLQRTTSDREAHLDNGVWWYNRQDDDDDDDDDGGAFGFSPVKAIFLCTADILGSGRHRGGIDEDEDGVCRLSWHFDQRGDPEAGAGWRAGHHIDLVEPRWKKMLYYC